MYKRQDSLSLGFYVDREPITNLAAESIRKVMASAALEGSFSAEMSLDINGGNYYYVAFAENSEDADYGVEKSIMVPRIVSSGEWVDGSQVDEFSGWWQSSWFGLYNGQFYPWVYHQNLGWVYVNSGSSEGSWLYHNRLGWMWTMPDVFPYLYLNKRDSWTYLSPERSKTTIYDYVEAEV